MTLLVLNNRAQYVISSVLPKPKLFKLKRDWLVTDIPLPATLMDIVPETYIAADIG